ncbi:MAG: oligopeptide/dipeptide ABC transporter ATP-binding protein [Thermodesulfobacteriota bacterium]
MGNTLKATPAEVVLETRDLVRHFQGKRRHFLGRKTTIRAVDGVSFTLHQGETLGLVGESGCGKSTVGKVILNILQPTSGRVFYRGRDISALKAAAEPSLHREMQMIFQDPLGALDPRMRVGDQICEPHAIFRIGTEKDRKQAACEMLDLMGLKAHIYTRYPHELSGGQQQRVVIARALILRPKVVVCDEPISALDVSIKAQVINLLSKLQDMLGVAYLFISHDLSAVRHICSRIAVMYLGQVVEMAERTDLFSTPLHPYSKALISAVPVPDPSVRRNRIILTGEPPSPIDPPSGCRFHTRCPIAQPVCSEVVPSLRTFGNGHTVLCHFPGEA